MEDFDPASLGAVAVDDYKQNTFDPSSLGAVAVEEFDPRSLGAQEVDDPRMSGVDEVSVARGIKPLTETEDTASDDWSGFVANMRISGNKLGQGIDIARVEQVNNWKKEADESKRYLDLLESKDPSVDVRDVSKLFGSLGAGQVYSLGKAREKYLKGEDSSFYDSALKTARNRYESTRKTFEEGAATIPQYVESISKKEKRIQELTPQLSPEMTKLNESEGAEFWKTFLSNPVESLANVIASSAIVGAPAVAGGAVGSLAGPAGTAAGSAYGSYITETTQSLLDSIKESGVDLSDPEKFQEALNNPMIMDKARQIAQARGVSVAAFDGLTAGLAGRFIGPVLQNNPTVKAALSATVKEIATQMAGGASGELTAQLAAAQDVSAKDIALEALGELGSGVTETIGNVRDANRILAETAAATPPPPATPQSTDVVTLPSGSTIVMEPGEVKSEQTPDAVWTQLSNDEREGLQVRLEALLEKKGSVEWSDIPVDLQNKIGTSEAHGIKAALKSDPEKAIADLVKAAPPTINPPSEVPEQQTSPTPQKPPKVLTPDERAKTLQPFIKEAERVAESMGATDPEQAASKAWADLSKSDLPLDNPRSLLLKFATGNAKDQLKASQAKSRGSGNVISMEGQDIENAAVETKGPRQETVEKEDLEQLKKAIGTFTPTEKKVGMMLADEMTVEEIAEELDMAVGSVKNIRTRLAQELGPYAQRMGYGKSLGPGAASADEDLVKYSMRKFAERFQEDESIHEDIRNQSGENYYEPIPFVQTGKEAGKIIEEMGEDKVANQITDPSSDITFAQRVVIGIELLTRLDNRYRKERDADPIAAAQTLEKAIAVNEWLKQYGTSLGQGVANFRQWGKRLKLHRMISAMQAANGGIHPSQVKGQMDFINEIDKDETETEERLDARITALEEEASLSHSDDVLSDRLKDQEKPEPLVLSIAERIEKIIQRNADAARARIRDRLMHARSGFDPVVAYDVMWLAAEQISKGIRKLSDWRKYAKNEFGEDIEPYIDQAWEDANAQIDKMVEGEVPEKKREPVKRIVKKMTGEEVREELTKRITKEAKEGGKLEDMVPLIRRLADAFIASGIRTRDPLVDALHAVIEPILPGTTKREVRDAFSGYGRFRELSKDDVSQVRRDLSAQSQLVSKYEDIKGGKPLKKSGVERTPTSDEQRRLSKLVEEAKRVHGVKVTDPARQLKSAQDAIKTRLKNEIKDMARQIETGEKPLGKSQTEWDAEIEALKVQRDRMKDVLSSLEDTKIPEETRIKNAERALEKSIEEIQRRIKNKETKTAKGTPLESEKLSVLRAQKEVLLAELDELRSADTALQEEKAFDALMKRKDQLEKQIASGDLFPATKEKPEDTELVKEAREMVNELQKQLADARRSSPESRKAQLDKAIASVESSIKALDARLQAGDLSTRESSPEVTTPELERLRAERAAMVKELNRQRREAAKPSESEARAKKDAKQIENLEKSIAALTQKINAKDLSTKPRKPLSTPEAQKLADYKKYLNDFLNDMRRAAKPKLTAEEVAMKAFKTRTAKEIARLEERIAKGDFSKRKPKQLDLSKDPEAVKLRAKINEVRQRFEKERLLTERKNRTGLQKTLDTAKEVLNLPRNMMSSMDFSAVLRQGGMLAFAHPVKAIKALKPMFQSAVSQDKFNELQASIESRPNNQNGTYKEAGLYLAETGDVKLSKKEEAIMSELGDKLPWVKASNRAYVAFLNQMRADSFDVLYEQLKKNGTPTEAELKALGNFVNVATGRGNFANHNEGAATLALFLFSPRLMVSRFQLLMGQPLWKGSGRTRYMIAKEYGKAALAVATFSMLAIMAGADYEDDSTSSDYGKLRFGNTRVDPWMGLIQPLVLASRAYHGSVKNGKGKTVPIREDAGKVPYGQARWSELAQKFVRSKLNPTVGGAFDLISGENVVGEKTNAMQTVSRMLTPLSIQDMGKVWEEHGMAKGTALNLLGILGMGVQNYEQRSDSKQRALEIMASPR